MISGKKNGPSSATAELGIAMAQFMKRTHLSQKEVRMESHFGTTKFSQFLKGSLPSISHDKFNDLMRTLARLRQDEFPDFWMALGKKLL